MLFHLVKKDFLIIKKYVLLMLVVAILIPPFLLWRVPEYAGSISFILEVIFAVFMLLQYISQKENQYPKAATLLCSTPYPRKLVVLSKYVFYLIIYAACCLIFWLESLVFDNLGGFHFEMVILTFLVITIFFSIYLPVQYKLGYEKTKFAFSIIIVASPFVLPQLIKMKSNVNLNLFNELSPFFLYGGVLLVSIILLMLSVCLSVRFYCNTDLA